MATLKLSEHLLEMKNLKPIFSNGEYKGFLALDSGDNALILFEGNNWLQHRIKYRNFIKITRRFNFNTANVLNWSTQYKLLYQIKINGMQFL